MTTLGVLAGGTAAARAKTKGLVGEGRYSEGRGRFMCCTCLGHKTVLRMTTTRSQRHAKRRNDGDERSLDMALVRKRNICCWKIVLWGILHYYSILFKKKICFLLILFLEKDCSDMPKLRPSTWTCLPKAKDKVVWLKKKKKSLECVQCLCGRRKRKIIWANGGRGTVSI